MTRFSVADVSIGFFLNASPETLSKNLFFFQSESSHLTDDCSQNCSCINGEITCRDINCDSSIAQCGLVEGAITCSCDFPNYRWNPETGICDGKESFRNIQNYLIIATGKITQQNSTKTSWTSQLMRICMISCIYQILPCM